MKLGYLYTKRMLRELTSRKNMISLLSLIIIILFISLIPPSLIPWTPATKESLIRLVENYFHLPPTEENLSIAFLAIELPPLIALFASSMVAIIPQKLMFYERVSGNIEILLSAYGNTREIAKALIISSLFISILIYGIFMFSGIFAIFMYEFIYHSFVPLPIPFYIYSFIFAPLVVILSVTIALLLTVLFPKLSSIENFTAITSSPLQLIAYAPSFVLILIMTFFPISPDILALYATPIVAALLIFTLLWAEKSMKRDILIRK